MKNSKKIINLIVGLISLLMFQRLVYLLIKSDVAFSLNKSYIFLAIVSYFLLHAIKMSRYYLILSESYMSLYDLASLYLRFSIVNILIPKKIGEIYKFYAIGEKIGNYKTALLSIITQIYFDLIAIVLVLIVNLLVFNNVNKFILILFLFTIIIASLVYLIFPSTYKYLNSYFILKTSKKRDIYALDILEQMNDLYKHQKDILKGKGGIILIISLVIWGLEYWVSFFIAQNISMDYNLNTFASYIANILVFETSSVNVLSIIYTIVGSIMFLLLLIGLILLKRWRQGKDEI